MSKKLTKKEWINRYADLSIKYHELQIGLRDALGQLCEINGELYNNRQKILNIALASVIKQFRTVMEKRHEEN